MRVLLCWILAASALVAEAQSSAPAVSADQSVADAVTVAPGGTCLEEERLEHRIARWLERERIDGDIRVQVQGGPNANDFRFTLRRKDASPTVREMSEVPGDCGDQHAAVALAIALAIDASLLGPLEEPEPTTVVAPTPIQPLPREEPFQPRISASLGGGAGVGFVTDKALGAFVALHGELMRNFELRLAGRWTGIFKAAWPELGINYDVGLTTASLGLCPVVRPLRSLSATACGEFLGGLFRTKAFGLRSAAVQNLPYWAVGAGLDFRIHVTARVSVRVSFDLVLPLIARSIVIDDPMGDVAGQRDLLPASVFLGLGPMFLLY